MCMRISKALGLTGTAPHNLKGGVAVGELSGPHAQPLHDGLPPPPLKPLPPPSPHDLCKLAVHRVFTTTDHTLAAS